MLKNKEQVFLSNHNNIQSFLLSAYHFLNIDYPKFYKMDNLSKLGWLASEVLLKNEAVIKETAANKIGIVLTNANASLDTDKKYFQSTKQIASPALFVYTLPNIVMGEICIRNNFKGENAFFIFEDFNAVFINQYVNNLFNNEILNCCICGWVDVVDENYKAVLFLVSTNGQQNLLFSQENINSIFKTL